MRYAILADLHSNLHALEAVLTAVQRAGADRIICAGDLVGYCPFPNEVVARMKRLAPFCIAGNHDRAVVHVNPSGMNPMAAAAVYWTAKNMNAEAVDYLKNLKSSLHFEIEGNRVGLYHGSPRDDGEYLYEIDASADLLEMANCDILITGHTHVPFIKKTRLGHIVNPGSVGQPRDNDPRASYALLDTADMSFGIHRVEYDVEAAEEAVRKAGLPEFLGTRLRMGI